MSRTNENITGNDKAIEADERNKARPEEADHLPLKDQPGEKGDPDHADD